MASWSDQTPAFHDKIKNKDFQQGTHRVACQLTFPPPAAEMLNCRTISVGYRSRAIDNMFLVVCMSNYQLEGFAYFFEIMLPFKRVQLPSGPAQSGPAECGSVTVGPLNIWALKQSGP